MFGRSFTLSLALSAGLLATGGPSLVAQEVDQQYDLKAAYLYKFTQYVEWPKNAVPADDKAIVIGVLGPNPFGPILDRIATKTVGDKKIVIRRFASVKDYQPCHILFVSGQADDKADEKTAEDRLKAVLAKTKGSAVLVVSDTEGPVKNGVMINFFIEGNTLKLEVNRKAVLGAGLTINSRLLALPNIKIVKANAANQFQDPGYHASIS